MKYKIGDKVRYDGGDWWFYGTVSAVFEHSICPCYRLSVERMEKKSCKFSITQFEFELEPYNEEVDIDKDTRKWGNTEIEYLKKYYGVLNNEDLSKMLKRSPHALEDKWRMIKQEPEPENEKAQNMETEPEKKQRRKRKQELKQETDQEKVELTLIQKEESPKRKRGDAWEKNFELFSKGEKSNAVYTWTAYNRRLYKTGKLPEAQFEKLMEINFPFEAVKKDKEKGESAQNQKKEPKRKRGEAWDINFEMYCKGEKSNIISTWIAQNRKLHKTGKLPVEKYEKLMGINFPFDVVQKKADSWDKQFEEWKNGDRKSIPMQQWRQRSVRQFLEGKLAADRVVKLKEVGILK